jgi:DNA invertase Pin-like site-specific DNA recombinase
MGVGRQEEDCRALADRLGWELAEVVIENDTSAYQTKRRLDEDGLPVRRTSRPEFRSVLKKLYAGIADGLVVYDIDRLARQPRDLEALIDLVDDHQVPIVAVTGSVNLSNAAGVAMARVLMAMANKSSHDTARRVARAARQQAEQGEFRTGGFRPFGYNIDGSINQTEAAILREMYDRILLGDPTRSVSQWLNASGIPTARGNQWSPQGVRACLKKPTSAGLRGYNGTVVADGRWEPIVDRNTWELACAVLDSRKRSTDRTGSVHLLSGIVTCGKCGRGMYVGQHGRKTSRQEAYRCMTHGCYAASRNKAWLEEHVVQVVEHLLATPPVARARRRQADGRPSNTVTQLVALRERRSQILRDFATDISATDLREMLAAVDGRIAELETDAAALGGGVRLPRAVEFRSLSLERQRSIIRALVRVEVHPQIRKGRLPEPETVRISPAY